MCDRKSFNHGKGEGGTTCFEVVLTLELKGLAIRKGWGRKTFPLFKRRWPQNVLSCLGGGGGRKCFGPVILLFCSPSLPVINDQSLKPNYSKTHVKK